MKRLISMLLLFAAVMSASAAVFTDSLGREIELPDTIDGIAPSGNLAQLVLYSVAPEKITGWSSRLSGSAREYFTQDVVNLPVFGTFYGKKANLNKEALMAAAPDVVIDMGEIKGSKEAMIADLDKLQDDILIPVIFIEAYLENTPEVYRTVGKLLGEEEKCEKLAVFAEEAINGSCYSILLILCRWTSGYSGREFPWRSDRKNRCRECCQGNAWRICG